jgi:hypothetical protein
MRRAVNLLTALAVALSPAVVAAQNMTYYTDANGNRVAVSPTTPLPTTSASTGSSSATTAAQGASGTDPWQFDLRRVGGVAIQTGAGASGTGTQRVAVSADTWLASSGYLYVATASGTGYSAGDLLERTVVTRTDTGAVQLVYWVNRSTGQAIAAPASGSYALAMATDARLAVLTGTVAATGSPAATAQTVQAASLPLPAGAATAVNQPGVATSGSAAPTTGTEAMIFDGTNAQRARDAGSANATTGAGLLGAGILGRYTSANASLTDGQFGVAKLGQGAQLYVTLAQANGNQVSVLGNGAGSIAVGYAGLMTVGFNNNYDGSAWQAQRGDATGAWVGGHSTLNTAQVAVGTSATLIAAARAGRQKLLLTLGAANDCYLGVSGVTTTTGFRVKGVDGATATLDTAAAVYGVCAAATTISYLEEF